MVLFRNFIIQNGCGHAVFIVMNIGFSRLIDDYLSAKFEIITEANKIGVFCSVFWVIPR